MVKAEAADIYDDDGTHRESGPLSLLLRLYHARLLLPPPPPLRVHGPRHDRRTDRLAGRGKYFKPAAEIFGKAGAGVCADF